MPALPGGGTWTASKSKCRRPPVFRASLAAMAVLWASGCLFPSDSGGEPNPSGRCPEAAVRLRFVHSAGEAPLVFDTAAYRTPAGSPFNIEKLQYYLSGFRLFGAGGETLFASDSAFYVDARDSTTWVHMLRGVPAGHVHTYGFTFGLAPGRNRTGSLPNTLENLNMAWPDPMGGGYHFMKLEGRFFDSLSRPYGYYVHVGRAGAGSADPSFSFLEERFPLHASVAEGRVLDLTIAMDVPEWLSGAAPYPLEEKAQGAMDDTAAQGLLRRNGEHGVFRTRTSEINLDASCP